MKWWQESVDEMWIGLMVALIAIFTVNATGVSAAALTVAGSAVSGLVVYLGVKPGKKNGKGDNNEPPTT